MIPQRDRLFLAFAALCLLMTLAGSAGASDPFAPPGTILVRTPIPSRDVMTELQKMGLQPEEAGRTDVLFRVTQAELERMRVLGLDPKAESDEQAPSEIMYTTYAQMTAALQLIATTYPSITRLVSIGRSVQNRDLWAICVTANPLVEEAEPEIRIVGAHHGNEKMGAELCLNLAQDLTQNYGVDPTITSLVDTREIWIVPIVNPDGYEANSRYNAHGVDINRNYGYMWEAGGGTAAFSEPETQAIRAFSTENWFDVSLSMHTSGDVVNSLWNYTPFYPQDDAVVVNLSNAYAGFSGYWAVHGWYWYETHGDTNDWSYGARGDLDWTIEVSNTNEAAVWNLNRPGMLAMIQAGGWGVHGVVTDAATGAPLRARVSVQGIAWPAFTDPTVGDYHKPLLAGTYTITVSANGYQDVAVPGVVVPSNGGVTVNVSMNAGGGRYADRVETARVTDPNNAHANPSLTMSVLGAPDGVGCSIGVSGEIVVDMGAGSEITNQSGADFTVTESNEDAFADGYSVYGGANALGPWTLIGSAIGTHAFDIAGAGLSSVRYIRVLDDGNGSADAPAAGFDLDAITVTPPAVAVADPPPPSRLVLTAWPEPTTASRGLEISFAAGGRAATLDLFDVTGARVARLARGAAGNARWDGFDAHGRAVPAGVYFVRLSDGERTVTTKVHVVD